MLKNIYLKGLILSLGLHATVLSFFFFNNNNFKKSESSMTEVIIVSSDESIPSDEKTDYQKKIKVTSIDQKKIHDVKKKLNKPTLESEIKFNNKNNNSQLKATIEPNTLKKKNHKENNEAKKNIFNELHAHEDFTSKTTKSIISKSASKKIFQSSASYRIGSENNPHPSYPLLARKKGWEGRVIIQANIDKKGNVKFIKVSESSGFKVLDDVSVETLKTWKFKPAMLGSKFVDDTVYIPVKFVLNN